MEVEVEIGEDDGTLLVQVNMQPPEQPASRVSRRLPEPHQQILQLRDWAEERWVEGHQVFDMVEVARQLLRTKLQNPKEQARGREWFEVVVSVVPEPEGPSNRRTVAESLPPQQRAWANNVADAISRQIRWEQGEEEAPSLMQRS